MTFQIPSGKFWLLIADSQLSRAIGKEHIKDFSLTPWLGIEFKTSFYQERSDLIMLEFNITDTRQFLLAKLKYGL